MNDLIITLLIIGVACLVLWLYFKFFKLYKVKSVVFVDGTVGSGKSFFCVALAIRLYKKNLRAYHIKKFLLKVFGFLPALKGKAEHLEKPLLYSNIKLRNIPFVKVSKDLFYRKNFRFAYKSVVLIDDASLLADQMMFKNKELSERLSLFFKLFRHETQGGYIILNSQSVNDNHYALKYVLSDYLYIHHLVKIPFVWVSAVQEMMYSADTGNITNVNAGDAEEKLKFICNWSKYRKYYDTYCYSIFTDKLPIYRKMREYTKDDDLKDADLVTFKDYEWLKENLDK